MRNAEREIAADLGLQAAKEAMEAIVRKTELGFTPPMKAMILTIALAMVEAKVRSMRKLSPLGAASQDLVDELSALIGQDDASSFAKMRAERGL